VKLKSREVDGVVIVGIEGRLIGELDSQPFRECIAGLLDQGKRHIIVDLHRCPWASSQGIGLLIGARASAATVGGELVLADVTERIRALLDVARLFVVFPAFGTVEDALRHLRQFENPLRAVQVHS
jgi:anti-sigma B factor antagonist